MDASAGSETAKNPPPRKRPRVRNTLRGTAARKAEARNALVAKLGGEERVFPIDSRGRLYDVICMDPPWQYRWQRGWCSVPYPTLSVAQMREMKLPAKKDCLLFMWATAAMVADAIELIGSLGFRYTAFWCTWIKTTKGAVTAESDSVVRVKSIRLGIGYYYRSNAEFLLLGVRGHGMTKQLMCRDFPSVYFSDRPPVHSQKPAELLRRIRYMFGSNAARMNFLELFAREPAEPGWDTWGLETEGFPKVKQAADARAALLPIVKQDIAICEYTKPQPGDSKS